MKTKQTVLLILLVSSLLLASVPENTIVKAETNTVVVPDDYDTVQEAVDAASDRDTVFVKSGTYNGSVTISKSLSLVGENKETTKIVGDWQLNGTAVLVEHDNVTISDLTIGNIGNSMSGRGVHLLHVSYCNVSNCNFPEEWIGIWLYGSSENIIENNYLDGKDSFVSSAGIKLQESYNNTIRGNIIENYNYGHGIVVESSTENILNKNIVSNCIGGIWCSTLANNNKITSNQVIIANSFFEDTPDNAIHGSFGVKIQSSSNNTITANTLLNIPNGVQVLLSASYNTIENNTINGSKFCGLGVADNASHNLIQENEILNNRHGLEIKLCTNNIFRNNDLSNNSYNIWVNGTELEEFIQDFDTSNTVDGKPVYYWVNQHDASVPSDAGFVALVNCTNITVTGLELSNNYNGLIFAYTTNCTLTKTVISDNYYGVKMYQSTNNSILESNLKQNYWAVWLYQSTENNITGNNIEANNKIGLVLTYSTNNKITTNNIANNQIGISFVNSSSNDIYHNNFINNNKQHVENTKHAVGYMPLPDGMQKFDNGYPSGGNYWDDYNGTDTDQDGIGDTPYLVSEYRSNTDEYPLMEPVEIEVIPEFSSGLILTIVMLSSLIIVLVRKKN
jgi:parallel beta-helix repeat protein